LTLYLFEPNVAVWPALRQRFGASRCRLSDAMDDYSAVPDASIGVAAMIHVLDHVLEPAELLRRLAAKLAPGGAVAIVTHDESSLMARLLGPRWLPYCLQHPQLYRPATIASAVAAAGLEVVKVSQTSNDFPLAYLMRHGLSAAGLPHGWVPATQRPALALKLGNLITVARRAGEAAPAIN
jgi:Methyltransferase domain